MPRRLPRSLAVAALGVLLLAGPALAQDSDFDGTPDHLDFCSADPLAPMPCFLDADNDGYGNRCDIDFNNDGVGGGDAGFLLADLATGTDSGLGTDMNCDGLVNAGDAELFLILFNGAGVPGPSGLPCAGTVPCP